MNYILKLNKIKIYKKNFISEYIFNIFLYKQGFQKKSNFTMNVGFIKLGKTEKHIFINRTLFWKWSSVNKKSIKLSNYLILNVFKI